MKNYLCNYGSLREKSSPPILYKCGEPCGSLKKLKLYIFEGCVDLRRSDSTNPSYRENTRKKITYWSGFMLLGDLISLQNMTLSIYKNIISLF